MEKEKKNDITLFESPSYVDSEEFKTVYAVFAYCGSYEDSTDSLMDVYLDYSDAEAFIIEQEELKEHIKESASSVFYSQYEQFEEEFRALKWKELFGDKSEEDELTDAEEELFNDATDTESGEFVKWLVSVKDLSQDTAENVVIFHQSTYEDSSLLNTHYYIVKTNLIDRTNGKTKDA